MKKYFFDESKSQTIDELKKENEELKQQLKKYKSANTNATHSIDWCSIDAFSIEREVHGICYRTIIGYWSKAETDVREAREWSFSCSIDEHEKLVKEFNTYIKEKNGS